MRAVTYDAYGDESVLRVVEDHPVPKVASDRALVRIRAAGVNRADAVVRAGGLEPMLDAIFPIVPGWDLSGVVEQLGYTASGIDVGDEVIGYVWMDYLCHGTYAEFTAAPIRTLAPKPRRASWEEAASLPLAGLTAYQAVASIELRAGATVLIQGAAGGVGSIAVQLLRMRGAEVVGVAAESNHPYLASLGARAVSYEADLGARVRAEAPDGIDAIIDCFGNGVLRDAVGLLAPAVPLTQVVTVADGASARSLGARVVGVRPDAAALAQLSRWVDDGTLAVHVRTTLPLDEAAEAHRLVVAGHGRGKVALTIP